MHKSAQKAAKRTKVAAPKAQPKRQIKKTQKPKKVQTAAKRFNATLSGAEIDTLPLRQTPPDFYKNRVNPTEAPSIYDHIPNGPTRAYTRAELPEIPSTSILLLHPSHLMHPAVFNQIRFGNGSNDPNHTHSLFLSEAVGDEFKMMAAHQDPLFRQKIANIKAKVAAQPFAEEEDQYWVSDPFGMHALTALRLAQHQQFSPELNPDDRITFAEASGTALGTSLLGIYLFDALTGYKFNLPGIVEVTPKVFESYLTSPHSNIVSRTINALPFAAIGTWATYGASKRLQQAVEKKNLLPDLSDPELRLAVKHLQRLHEALVDGTYREKAVAAFDRHGESVANVLPNGHLIDERFNFDFFMPPAIKKTKSEHH